MLALTRMVGESIMIGNDIEIQIVEVNGGRVRVGIQAPTELSILRKELYLDVKNQNLQSKISTKKVGMAGKIKSLFSIK